MLARYTWAGRSASGGRPQAALASRRVVNDGRRQSRFDWRVCPSRLLPMVRPLSRSPYETSTNRRGVLGGRGALRPWRACGPPRTDACSRFMPGRADAPRRPGEPPALDGVRGRPGYRCRLAEQRGGDPGGPSGPSDGTHVAGPIGRPPPQPGGCAPISGLVLLARIELLSRRTRRAMRRVEIPDRQDCARDLNQKSRYGGRRVAKSGTFPLPRARRPSPPGRNRRSEARAISGPSPADSID